MNSLLKKTFPLGRQPKQSKSSLQLVNLPGTQALMKDRYFTTCYPFHLPSILCLTTLTTLTTLTVNGRHKHSFTLLASLVQGLDNAIHQINRFPVEKY